MATAALSGKTGTVSNANSSTEVTEWSATLTEAALQATSVASSGWEEFIAGLKGATLSLAGIGTMPTTGAASSLTLANSAGTLSVSGDAFLTSVPVTNPVDGVVGWTADGVFSGEVTIVV